MSWKVTAIVLIVICALLLVALYVETTRANDLQGIASDWCGYTIDLSNLTNRCLLDLSKAYDFNLTYVNIPNCTGLKDL